MEIYNTEEIAKAYQTYKPNNLYFEKIEFASAKNILVIGRVSK